jgi:hypothetical protein
VPVTINAEYTTAPITIPGGATPLPTAPTGFTTALGSGGVQGLQVFTKAGPLGTVSYAPYTVDGVAIDDSGTMYLAHGETLPPTAGASPSPLGAPLVRKYAFESRAPLGSYTISGSREVLISVSGGGRLVVQSFTSGSNGYTMYFDVWETGVTGTPSFTVTVPSITSACPNGVAFSPAFMTHDGTLMVPSHDPSTGVQDYAFYPNGSSTPSSVITESYVPAVQQCGFSPNYVTIDANGVLYVSEFTFGPQDNLAGLYIYNHGNETYVATPADANNVNQPYPAPQSVDVDAAGNIYVSSDNSVFTSAGYSADTLDDVAIYGPLGTSLTRVVQGSGQFGAPYTLIVDSDGTLYLSDYGTANGNPLEPNGALYVLAPGSSTVSTIAGFTAAVNLALWNGTTSRNILSVGAGSRGGGSHGGGYHRVFGRRR